MKILSLLVLLAFFQLPSFGNEEFLIKKSDISWMKPARDSYVSKLNQTMEIGFDLNRTIAQQIKNFLSGAEGIQLNPYDAEDVDVIAIFNSPSGKTKKGIGFYYQDFKEDLEEDIFLAKRTEEPWRVRFAPDEVGNWIVQVEIKAKGFDNPIMYSVKFKCEESDHKGRLTVHHTGTDEDRYLYYKQSGERFMTVGMNIANGGFFHYKPSLNNFHMYGVETMAASGGNFIRFELGAQNALPDWFDIHNYQNKQDEMFAFDRTMNLAEKHKVYAIMFRHHVEIMGDDWDVPNWQNNPYRKEFGMEKISDYFTNEKAIKYQKQNIRYMYARWGYSPYWSFYGYSEVEKFFKPIMEQEGISDVAGVALFKKWFEDQKEYIRAELDPDALFANSYGITVKPEKKMGYDGVLKASDVTTIHIYSTIKDGNYANRAEAVDKYWESHKQPVIMEEMGINDDKLVLYCCTGIEFHNSMWATTFMGSTGSGMDWWWNRGIMHASYEETMVSLEKFIRPLNDKSKVYAPFRWQDAGEKSRKIESYALVSADKKNAYGWLHNATYYWRNEAQSNPCVQSLLDSSNVIDPCVVEDGTRIGRNELPRDYASDRHEDKYSNKGGFQPINGSLESNPTFKVDGFSKGRGKNRVWYKVTFYSTRIGEDLKPIEGFNQLVRAGFGKKLKIVVPNLNDSNPDVAYKIIEYGRAKKKANVKPYKIGNFL